MFSKFLEKLNLLLIWIFFLFFLILSFLGILLFVLGNRDDAAIVLSILCPPIAILLYFIGPRRQKKMKLKEIQIHLEEEQITLEEEKGKEDKEDLDFITKYSKYKLEALKDARKQLEEQQKILLDAADAQTELLAAQKKMIITKHKPITSDEIWKCFENNDVCIGMHIELVEWLYGKPDEKKNITKDRTIITYQYGKYKNQRGNWSYRYEAKFEDELLIAFKEL